MALLWPPRASLEPEIYFAMAIHFFGLPLSIDRLRILIGSTSVTGV
jgi:hypothetical protein